MESPYGPEDFIVEHVHMDKSGKVWSLDPNDKSYYDVARKTYCINLDKPARMEEVFMVPEPELRGTQIVIDIKARENMAQEVREAIERQRRTGRHY